MACDAPEARTCQHVDTVVEPFEDVGGRERPRACRRQLERERETVEPTAELGDDVEVRVRVAGTGVAGPSMNGRIDAASGSLVPGAGSASGPSVMIDSSGAASGERLVAITVGDGHAASSAFNASAAPAPTCSQLSITSSAGWSSGATSSESNEGKPS